MGVGNAEKFRCANGESSELFKRLISSGPLSRPTGVKTPQRKPTNRPEEHSCLNAIISQNCSRLLTLFQRPGCLVFEGLFGFCEGGSGSSASSSSTKRALGSSGNRGIKHLSGRFGDLPRSRSGSAGSHFLGNGGFWNLLGKKLVISCESQPGTLKNPRAV